MRDIILFAATAVAAGIFMGRGGEHFKEKRHLPGTGNMALVVVLLALYQWNVQEDTLGTIATSATIVSAILAAAVLAAYVLPQHLRRGRTIPK